MTREQRIVETLVELADTMIADFDVVEFLHRVVEYSVELLDCAEAGILLADAAGVLRVMASSSERAEVLEVLQAQHDEGPCFECYQRGKPVRSDDLKTDQGRWPVFSPVAVEKGFRSVQALPMRVHGETIGALNLFRCVVGRLPEQDISVGQGMADIASVALLAERTVRESRSVVEQLQGALGSRVMIEQAKGLLAERKQIGVDAAFVILRGYARAHSRRLADVARELLDGRLEASELVPRARDASR